MSEPQTTPQDPAPAADPTATPAPAATPDPTAPVAGDPTPDPTPLDDATQKLVDEAAKAGSRKANAEAAALRKRLKEFEDAEEARKLAALSDTERLQKERDDATAKAEQATRQARDAALRAEVAVLATGLNLVDADVALQLMDQSGIEWGESGRPTGVKQALEQLATAKPFLVGRPGTPALDPSNPGRGPEPQLSPQEETRRLFGARQATQVYNIPRSE